MIKYTVKRLLMMIPVIIGVNFLVFSIMYISPSDPAEILLGQNATEEALTRLRSEMGLDKPYLVQYGNYLKDMLKGDLGKSYRNKKSVFSEIVSRMPVTFIIAAFSMILATVIGLIIGILSAVRQYTVFDSFSTVFALLFAAVPVFWMAMTLVSIFSLKLDWLPASGLQGWKGYVLPVVASGIVCSASVIRMTRSSMLEVIRQDYIRTIQSKGAAEWYIITKHALKNALLPIITVAGNIFGRLLGGAVICETVFALPGIGLLLVDGVRGQDIPIVLGAVTFIAVAFSLVNLTADLLYTVFDPRIKAQYSK